MIGYIGEVITPLVLISPKMGGYVKTFKVKNGDKDNYKLMSFHIYDGKLLEKYKTIGTKIEGLLNIRLDALSVYDRYIKTKIRTSRDKVCTNFHSWNVPEDAVECESFTIISIDSLLVYENKYYLEVYFDNCAYKIVGKQWQIILIAIFLKLMKIS